MKDGINKKVIYNRLMFSYEQSVTEDLIFSLSNTIDGIYTDIDFNRILPMPEEYNISEKKDWWCKINWGTEKNAFNTYVENSMSICFSTYDPIFPLVHKLSEISSSTITYQTASSEEGRHASHFIFWNGVVEDMITTAFDDYSVEAFHTLFSICPDIQKKYKYKNGAYIKKLLYRALNI